MGQSSLTKPDASAFAVNKALEPARGKHDLQV
jgi:hypothetical protein